MEVLRYGDLFGPFKIERHLGTGRGGPTYAATSSSGASRALRIVADGDDLAWGRLAALSRDAHALTSAIVAIDEIVTLDDGRIGLVSERFVGRDLRGVESKEVPDVIRDVAETLDAIHARGLVHGALSIGNVFRAVVSGGQRVTRVLDFGFGAWRGDASFQSMPLESAQCISPQLIAGATPSAADDVYALAALAWKLLTYQPMYGARTTEALLHEKRTAKDAPRPERSEHVTESVASVLRAGLAVDPAERISSAGRFAGVLDAALSQPPPQKSTRAPFMTPSSLPPVNPPTPQDQRAPIPPLPAFPPLPPRPPQPKPVPPWTFDDWLRLLKKATGEGAIEHDELRTEGITIRINRALSSIEVAGARVRLGSRPDETSGEKALHTLVNAARACANATFTAPTTAIVEAALTPLGLTARSQWSSSHSMFGMPRARINDPHGDVYARYALPSLIEGGVIAAVVGAELHLGRLAPTWVSSHELGVGERWFAVLSAIPADVAAATSWIRALHALSDDLLRAPTYTCAFCNKTFPAIHFHADLGACHGCAESKLRVVH